MMRSTSALALATTSSIRPGWIRPSPISFVSATRAISRRTGSKPRQHDRLRRVVDDQVDAGRLLEGADVAPLAADDPALHLVVRQVDDGDRVLGGVVGGDALDRGDDDVAGLLVGLVAGLPLDRAAELDRVVLGLLADGLEQERLGVLGRDAAHPLEGGDLLLVGLRDLLASSVDLALALEELAVALLEHVGALIELLVALEEAALERRQLVSPGSRLVLGLALHPELLVLGLEDQLLLAGAGLRFDPTRLGVSGLHRLRRPVRAGEHAEHGSADGAQQGRRGDDQWFHLRPPVRSVRDRRNLCVRTARSWRYLLRRERGGSPETHRWVTIAPFSRCRRRSGGAWVLCA